MVDKWSNNRVIMHHNHNFSAIPMAGYGYLKSPRTPPVVPRSQPQPQPCPVLGQSLEKSLCDQPLNIPLSNVELAVFGQVDHPVPNQTQSAIGPSRTR